MKNYSESYLSKRAKKYDKTSWVKNEGFIDAFLDMIPNQTFSKILEVGIGTGAVADIMCEKKRPLPGIDISKEMMVKLLEKPSLLDVDRVIIENQPVLKNPTMKTFQMLLYSYFLMNGICKNKNVNDIQMINARNKLKVYNGPKIECDIKDKYKKNKFLAIQYCDIMIKENPHIDEKFHKLYDESKKKDDLSDAYLQGIYYIQKLDD